MQYWRIRMKAGKYGDFTKTSWNRNEVGIWYGAWTADDFKNAVLDPDPCRYLNTLPNQRALPWNVSRPYFETAKRFFGIKASDWVFCYFDEALHLAQCDDAIRSGVDHPLNQNPGGPTEVFKYRRVSGKKSFRLADLPDCFRLLSSAGRSNVHEVHGTRPLIEMLARSMSAADVTTIIRAMPRDTWLETLGPNSWESLCFAYLILEEGFVPTGLGIGHTLPVFDIIGRSASGTRILAQCKKDPNPGEIESTFLKAVDEGDPADICYYFAFGGISGQIPEKVKIITRLEILNWMEMDSDGQRYYKLLL
jgi:hypothetical protein